MSSKAADDALDLRNHVTEDDKAKLTNRAGQITHAQAQYGIALEDIREYVPADKMLAFERASAAAFQEINNQLITLARALEDATEYVKQVRDVNTKLVKNAAGRR